MDAFLTTFMEVWLEATEHHIWPPGEAVRGAVRAAYSLWLVLEGSLEATIAGKRWEVPAGAVFLLPGNVPHDVVTAHEAQWLSVGLRATLFGHLDLLESLNPPVLSRSDPEQRRALLGLLEQLIAAGQDVQPAEGAAALFGEGLGRALFALCWQILGGGDLAVTVSRPLPEWLLGALHRIRRDPRVRPGALSQELGVHPLRLRRGFHKYLGISPQAYLIHARLEEARCLLAMTDLSVRAVAERVGFESLPRFSARFKQTYGQAPTYYRRSVVSLPAGLPPDWSLPQSPERKG